MNKYNNVLEELKYELTGRIHDLFDTSLCDCEINYDHYNYVRDTIFYNHMNGLRHPYRDVCAIVREWFDRHPEYKKRV